MPITEKGYHPYEGKRLSAHRNHWVVMWMEIQRIWSSLTVKIVVIVAVIWGIVGVAIEIIRAYLNSFITTYGTSGLAETQISQNLISSLSANVVVDCIDWQVFFVVLLSLAWGSNAIASDIQNRVLQFYFAKPLTEKGYLIGKISPLAFYCFVLSIFPAIIMIIAEAILLKNQGVVASRLALILPSIVYCGALSVFVAAGAVGMSALSNSRLLTFTFWAALLYVPYAVAWIIDVATQGQNTWFYVISPLSMMGLLGKSIFRIDVQEPVEWYHALTFIGALCVFSIWIAWQRLSKPEVIG